jgi:hypothetical protein
MRPLGHRFEPSVGDAHCERCLRIGLVVAPARTDIDWHSGSSSAYAIALITPLHLFFETSCIRSRLFMLQSSSQCRHSNHLSDRAQKSRGHCYTCNTNRQHLPLPSATNSISSHPRNATHRIKTCPSTPLLSPPLHSSAPES